MINIYMNYRNYIKIDAGILYIFYILYKNNRKGKGEIGYIIIMIVIIIMTKNIYKIIIMLEIISMINYFIIIKNKKTMNIILIYFILNIISTLYLLTLLINPYIINFFHIYLFYKLGIFPFNKIILEIYKKLKINAILYINIFPKYLYLSLIPQNNKYKIYSIMTMITNISIIKSKKIKEVVVGYLIFNTGLYIYMRENWKELYIITTIHLLIFSINLLHFSSSLFNLFFYFSWLGIPPFLGFYKYLYIYPKGMSDPIIIIIYIINIYYSYILLNFLITYTNSKNYNFFNIFLLFLPLEFFLY